VLVIGDDRVDPGGRPGLVPCRRAAVGEASFDDLEPHPVAGVQGYAESLGDLGQLGRDDELVSVNRPGWRRGS
jgi:hypothetical protein